MNENINDALGTKSTVDEQYVSGTPKVSLEDQEVAWADLHNYFITGGQTPESDAGKDYLEVYYKLQDHDAAQVRRLGFREDWYEYSGDIYDILKGDL